jgi:RES domain-containing protein
MMRSEDADVSADLPLRLMSGRFWRVVRADRIADVLAVPAPDSAGRYHRPGQAALYMSPEMDWARLAVLPYLREDGFARVAIPLEVGAVQVLDQFDDGVATALGIDPAAAAAPWRSALAVGAESASWQVSDTARAAGLGGVIDPSRRIPGGWHLALFRWNEPGAPNVRVAGDAVGIGED